MAVMQNPSTLAAFYLLVGYYVCYYIRVLQKSERATLMYACDYLGESPPDLADPRLLTCLVMHRTIFMRGMPAMRWIPGGVPDGLVRIGNIPPTPTEVWKNEAGDVRVEVVGVHHEPVIEAVGIAMQGRTARAGL